MPRPIMVSAAQRSSKGGSIPSSPTAKSVAASSRSGNSVPSSPTAVSRARSSSVSTAGRGRGGASVPSSPTTKSGGSYSRGGGGHSRAGGSVPASPTALQQAQRSIRGLFLNVTSPSAPSKKLACATCQCQCQCAQNDVIPSPAPHAFPSSTPGAFSGTCKASSAWEYGKYCSPRPLLWVLVILFVNYMGHIHPFLWSSAERQAILTSISPRGTSSASSTAALSRRSLRSMDRSTEEQEEDLAVAWASAIGDAGAPKRRSIIESSEDGQLLLQGPTFDPSRVTEPKPTGLSPTNATDEDPNSSSSTLTGTSSTPSLTTTTGTSLSQALPATDAVTGGSGSSSSGISSPYVTAWAIDMAQHKSCKKLYPQHLVRRAVQAPIGFVGDLLRKKQRLLVAVPRHGLGNSMRGYVSSFVYAMLSGRKLVRFHGAEHAKVFDTLCHSFQCGFDAIEVDETTGDAMGLYKQLEKLNPVDLNSRFKTSPQKLLSLRTTWGLFVTKSPHFFDGFWQNFPHVRSCIYDAFGCSSSWCVHSRAMQALVGPPTSLLEEVISKVLKRHQGQGLPDVPAQRDSAEMFDISLHLRTRPTAIESKHPGEESAKALMRIGCGAHDTGDADQYLRSCLWDCLGGLIQKLDDERAQKGRPLQILLATDNEALRPAFVEKLAKYGTVYYSSGVIVHSSKSASLEAERLPTMAEFHLMSRSHTILEANSYISTFAHFSGLLGNGTVAGIDWHKDGGCSLKVVHKGELVQQSHSLTALQ